MTGRGNGNARRGGRDEHLDQPELFDRLLTTSEKKALAREMRQHFALLRKEIADYHSKLLARERQMAVHLKTVRVNNRQAIGEARETIAAAARELALQTTAQGLTVEAGRAVLARLPMLVGLMISAPSSAVPLRKLIYVAWQILLLRTADAPSAVETLVEVVVSAISSTPDQLPGKAEAWFQASLTNRLAVLDPLGCEPSVIATKEVPQ